LTVQDTTRNRATKEEREKMSNSRQLFIVVVGCGRLGAYLANRLSKNGHSLVSIDNDPSAFEGLSSEYGGFQIEGDATEFSIFKQAKMHKADMVIATTRDDNINLMVAQIAKEIFNVPKVLARVYDPNRVAIYHELGVVGICPTLIAGDEFLHFLSSVETGKS
jgi:trk system potassium uptake protein